MLSIGRIVLEVVSVIQNHLLAVSPIWIFGVDELLPMKCSNFIPHANHIRAVYSHGPIFDRKSLALLRYRKQHQPYEFCFVSLLIIKKK